ncbi:META domain-containing protein [Parabacteroides sp. PF5-9]|uniref:META domain-containing protein n=1 Tax=Parabacteroides sp. PF5-9 TaxID=1742404 RepID=UPI002472ED6F|nr:META domain-containing protein [Parabacteroides sp. PF5-9]MDH6357270.1 heat shock protein HslJ [Parabacteroides sp. PF5-9]
MKVEKKFVLFLLVSVCLFCSCEDNESNNENILTNTQWRLEGFVNGNTGKMTPPLREGNLYYTLYFDRNTLIGMGAVNTFKGKYTIDNTANLAMQIIQQSHEQSGKGDDQKYISALKSVRSYKKTTSVLSLYYEGNNFMKFKRMGNGNN